MTSQHFFEAKVLQKLFTKGLFNDIALLPFEGINSQIASCCDVWRKTQPPQTSVKKSQLSDASKYDGALGRFQNTMSRSRANCGTQEALLSSRYPRK